MIVRSEWVNASSCIQLNVAAKDISERMCLHKVDHSPGAFAVGGQIVNQQSTWHQEIAGKKNAGSVVVKCHVRLVVTGRWNHVHYSVAQIDMGNFVRPILEPEKRSNPF